MLKPVQHDEKYVIPNLFRNLGPGNDNKSIPFYKCSICSFIGFLLRTPCSELSCLFQEVEDGLVDRFGSFPHGDVTALFNDMQCRTFDGAMEARAYGKGKDEVSLPPDEERGALDKGEIVIKP